jgi:hypothetical protein
MDDLKEKKKDGEFSHFFSAGMYLANSIATVDI